MNGPRGRFITLEGGEGAGKTTQQGLLADALRAAGLDVLTTREPGGSPGAEEIRRLFVSGDPGRWDAMTELLLIYAARRDHVQRTILPALNAGTLVLCDRFADSTMAYQGYGRGLGRDAVETVHRLVLGELRPDLTLVFDLPPEQGLARAAGRTGSGETRFEEMDLEFHRRLRAAFLEIAGLEPRRCVVIDAASDPATVAAAAHAAVDRLIAASRP